VRDHAEPSSRSALRSPDPHEDTEATEEAEKLSALGVMNCPKLRPGKFRVPDQLMATLKGATVMRTPGTTYP
jgi:hypothetical protein